MQYSSEEIMDAVAKKLTLQKIKMEFARQLNVSENAIAQVMRIESEDRDAQGRITLTVSVPNSIAINKLVDYASVDVNLE